MKNILISGGAGFIGSNLAIKLVQLGYKVTVFDNLSEQIHGNNPEQTSFLYKNICGKVRFLLGSVTSRQDWEIALHDQDLVVHLAAETGTGQSMYKISDYVNVNIGGTALLLDVLANSKRFKVKKMIVASSRSIYGEGRYTDRNGFFVYPKHRNLEDLEKGDFEIRDSNSLPLTVVSTDEGSKIHPSSVYGITKQNQEQLVMTICPTIGIQAVAFRYQNVYGPGQSLTNPYTGILSIFSTLIRNKKAINIFEDGKESRDFVFIDDVVKATLLGIEKDNANGKIFNVGTGVPIDVSTVAANLMSNYGINVPVKISANYRLGDIRHNFADIKYIESELGFKCTVSFEQGLRQFCSWVMTQDVKESLYEQSIDEMKAKGLYK